MATSQKSSTATPDSSMSCMSVEQERDSYKEKVEHLKLLIKQYQQDLKSQKYRNGGVETVSNLLHEAKQENNALLKKNRTLETAISNLQSRLTSNGLSGSLNIEETDIFVHGTSKQLLDNLAKENSRLRTLLKGASLDPEEIQQLHQTTKEQLGEIENLNGELQKQIVKVMELERLLNSSDSEKDAEITKLRHQVKDMKESSRTREVLCSSLAEETHNLRQQLHDVALRCQQMALRLEENKENAKKTKLDQDDSSPSAELLKLKDDNFTLQSQLEEVTKMNHRWQAYNNSNELKMRELMEELENARAFSVSPERTESINKALEEAKHKLRSLEKQKHQLERDLEEKKSLLLLQSQEIEKLRADLDTSRDALSRTRQQHVKVEHNYLSNQGIYNDFNLTPAGQQNFPYDTQLAARGPRASPAADKQSEVDGSLQTDAEPHSGSKLISTSITGKRSPAFSDKESDNNKTETNNDNDYGLSGTVPLLNDLEDDHTENEDLRQSSNGSRKNSQILTCPKCGREFVTEEHTDLLEHLELCCD
ncbi:hypothetical protein FSP39_000184 [Pinctada imbricata]|uniref:TNFAIP3-interacting protein 2 n=1 Tax=Pinctada imbricata TaxID=66713 RepID=A0AA88YD65_PINIB|nr:hypothetical protein FSP39_000184 [Pinctada imbricata]